MTGRRHRCAGASKVSSIIRAIYGRGLLRRLKEIIMEVKETDRVLDT